MSHRYRIEDQQGINFLTFTTIGWIDLFTRPVYKEIILDSLKFCRKKKGLLLQGYILMPNHLHLIVSAAPGKYLSDIVRDFKKFTSSEIKGYLQDYQNIESRRDWMSSIFGIAGRDNPANKEFQLWKNDNHPIALYSLEVIKQKLEYIHMNPVRAGFVSCPEHWIYSSASNYAGIESIIEIDFLW
jgi:putative transposase